MAEKLDEKYLEFWFKLNTYLRRQKILAEKMHRQEELMTINVLAARAVVPPDVFRHIFDPMLHTLEERKNLMLEMSESSDEFIKQMTSFSKEVRSSLHDD